MADSSNQREKIAILGGGMGALTSAYWLSHTPELREKYEITIYQMGWRLGGKLASGSNTENHFRNEEHGIHVWFGFYDNAFGTLKEVYEKLAVIYPKYRYQTYLDAMKPQTLTPFGNYINGKYGWWNVEWPTLPGTPGVGDVLPEPLEIVLEILERLHKHSGSLISEFTVKPKGSASPLKWIKWAALSVVSVFSKFSKNKKPTEMLGFLQTAKETVKASMEALKDNSITDEKVSKHHVSVIYFLIKEFQKIVMPLLVEIAKSNPDKHPFISAIDIGVAWLAGFFNPEYGITKDFNLNRVNNFDFRDWLIRNGGKSEIMNESSWIRALYDTPYEYVDGDLSKPSFAVAPASIFGIRAGLTYKGAVLYLPQAGFGEAVISPLYEVLKSQGVKFKFFHKVKKLKLTPDQNQIKSVIFERQVDTVDGKDYNPVFWTEANLISWPVQPLWEQIKNGTEMKKNNVNWESNWNQWPAAGETIIEGGVEFDRVILAVALGAFKKLNDQDESFAKELIDADQNFSAMCENLNIVATFGQQFWCTKTLADLGWDKKPASVSGPEPVDVWIDMSQVLETEQWDKNKSPLSLQYLTGPTATTLYRNPTSMADTPKKGKELIRDVTVKWLNSFGTVNFPKAATQSGAFDWNVLFDESNQQGEARIDAQYLRLNVDPTECCVHSAKDTVQYRRKPEQSGFTNLYLAGDWTYTGINVTCVEATTISGKMAARAISGQPKHIVGETFLNQQEVKS